MLAGKRYSLKEIGRIARRRKWLLIVPFAVGLTATPLVAGAWLEQYRSEATITLVSPDAADQTAAASGIGGLAGLAVGLVLVVLSEYRDLSLRSEDDVRRVLTVPVLGSIPIIDGKHERRAQPRGPVSIRS